MSKPMDHTSQERSPSDGNTDAQCIERQILGLTNEIQISFAGLCGPTTDNLSTETQSDIPLVNGANTGEPLRLFPIAMPTPRDAIQPVHDHAIQRFSYSGEVAEQGTHIAGENMQEGGAQIANITQDNHQQVVEQTTNTAEENVPQVAYDSQNSENVDDKILPPTPKISSSKRKIKRKKGNELGIFLKDIMKEEPKEHSPDISKDSTELNYYGDIISVDVRCFDDATFLGQGKFGEVYAVIVQEQCKILTAVKCMKRERDIFGFSSAYTELSAMKMIGFGRNPFIVDYYGAMINTCTGRLCIWLEFMNGTIEDFYVTMHSLNETTFDKLDFLIRRVVYNITSGLLFLETKGILHRDVKPANMLINRNAMVKLCDFGISCSLLESVILRGTALYIPPVYKERAIQNDMWALGISLLEIISGKHPFLDWILETLSIEILRWELEIPTTISKQMQQLISHLLKKIPDERPRSYTDIIEQLHRWNVTSTISTNERNFVLYIIDNIIKVGVSVS